jgi:hypothetical protein
MISHEEPEGHEEAQRRNHGSSLPEKAHLAMSSFARSIEKTPVGRLGSTGIAHRLRVLRVKK